MRDLSRREGETVFTHLARLAEECRLNSKAIKNAELHPCQSLEEALKAESIVKAELR